MKNFKTSLLFIAAVILTLGLSIAFQSLLAAYTAPLANPAACVTGNPGCDAPLNVGSSNQSMAGSLGVVGAFAVGDNAYFAGKVGINVSLPPASVQMQINAPAGTEGLRIISADNWSPLNIRNNANTADIFRVDQTGTLVTGTVPWARLSTFPTACASGKYVTAVGATLTCADPPTESGDAVIGNEVLGTANTTLTRSGDGLTIATAYKLALNLDNANTWTGVQTINAAAAAVLKIIGGGDLQINAQDGIGANSTFYNDTGILVLSTPLSISGSLTVSGGATISSGATINGDLNMNGDINMAGGDISEGFKILGRVEPGDVLVISEQADGQLIKSSQPYQKTVAGVVSTDPAVKLGDKNQPQVALSGTAPVKVSGENGPINPGDLLTTATLPGYAMKCSDQKKCFGAIIGKALEKFSGQTGVIKMLISLQ